MLKAFLILNKMNRVKIKSNEEKNFT